MLPRVVPLALAASFLTLAASMASLEAPPVNQGERPCKKYDGDGCSVPFGLPFFYKTQFTLSCDRHDVCYHCGVAYGIPKSRCDKAFRHNTLATCKSSYLTAPSEQTGLSASMVRNHRARIIRAVDELGFDQLGVNITLVMADCILNHPKTATEELAARCLRPWVRTELIAQWASAVADQVLQADSGKGKGKDVQWRVRSTKPKAKPGFGNFEPNWCEEVTKYLVSHNNTGPLKTLDCPDIRYATCDFFSEIYYLAVCIFGASSYQKTAEFYCHQSFVPKCIPS